MKRMAIFVFYDFQGIVDEYVKYLLQSLNAVTDKIIIVSNGNLDKRAREELEVITEFIYERDNKGFDAGAYKDVFTSYLNNESFDQWDEMILLNDTCYGPVYPWQEVFEKMDRQNVDFWGMTKQECYKWNDGATLPPHVQSYFLAVRKSVLLADSFHKFWEQMDYPDNLDNAILNFEVKFTNYFSKKGFKYGVYTDVCGGDIFMNKSELTYSYYITDLLVTARMPLIKRKALFLNNFEKAHVALEFVSAHTDYDINLIRNHITRLDVNHKLLPFGYIELDNFCEKFAKVYIYGHGKIGHIVEKYLSWKKIKIVNFIVTERKESDETDVISYQDLVVDQNTGVILALGKNNVKQVMLMIADDIPKTQLLIPRF